MSFRATRARTPCVRAGDPTVLATADLGVAFLRWLDGRARSELLRVGPPSRVTTVALTPRADDGWALRGAAP